ncbi:complex 1 protein-domain-containing protein [Flammula alnicola]|nr:complex 1 protein-domain-containing protein [Flammula alnicola]
MTIPGPTLKHFILKQQVLDLYRHAVRASKVIPDPVTRKETVAWIREEFERNKHLTDVVLIEEKLKIARREIKSILPTYFNKPN